MTVAATTTGEIVERLRAVVSVAWEGREDEPFRKVGWAGEVGADDVARVGTVELTVPAPPPAFTMVRDRRFPDARPATGLLERAGMMA